MKFVRNPGAIWTKYSTIALAALTSFSSLWMASPDVQALVSAELAMKINGWVALFGFIGRFIDQTSKASKDAADKIK